MPVARPVDGSEEKHERQFRGTWTPPAIFELVANGVINTVDAFILLNIDSYTSNKCLCWASNAYLGRMVNIGPEAARQSLAKLEQKKLIERTNGWDDKQRPRRYLKSLLSGVEPPSLATKKIWGGGPKKFGPDKGKYKAGTNVPASPVSKHNKKGVNMPIFDRTLTPTNTTPFATGCALRLINAVKHAGKINTPYRQTSWAKHFDLLTTVDGVPPARVTKALDWYTTNITGQYTPRAYSAQSFRAKFPAIEAAMQRATPKLVGLAPSAIANTIAGGIIKNQWPANAQLEHLPAAIEQSLQNYTAYRNRLAKHRNAAGRLGRAVNFLLETMPPARTVVTTWWDDVYATIHKLKQWGGAFDKFVLAHNTPRFRSMFDEWVTGYTTDVAIHRQLLELITDED